MTPLLAIALTATLAASTPPTTINHTPHHEEHTTMADGTTAPRGVGGGSNRQNRRPTDPFRIDLITNPTNRGSGYPTLRGTNPIPHTLPATFTEHTKRPA